MYLSIPSLYRTSLAVPSVCLVLFVLNVQLQFWLVYDILRLPHPHPVTFHSVDMCARHCNIFTCDGQYTMLTCVWHCYRADMWMTSCSWYVWQIPGCCYVNDNDCISHHQDILSILDAAIQMRLVSEMSISVVIPSSNCSVLSTLMRLRQLWVKY